MKSSLLKRSCLALGLLLMLWTNVRAQQPVVECLGHAQTPSSGAPVAHKTTASYPCAPTSAAFFNRYGVQANYIPGVSSAANTVGKTLKVNVIVFTDPNNPTYNYQNSTQINDVFYWVNKYLGNGATPTAPSDPVSGGYILSDTKLRVEVVGIKFVSDASIQWHFGMHSLLPTHGVDYENTLNIFFAYSYGGAGGHVEHDPLSTALFSNNPNSVNLNADQVLQGINDDIPLVITKNYRKVLLNDPWQAAANLLHEIAHVCGLGHLYTNTGFAEPCDQNYRDYLWDVFGSGGMAMCPRVAAPNPFCNSGASPNDGCTNNILGGQAQGSHISALQVARIHRNAQFLSIRKYFYNTDPNIAHNNTAEGQVHPHEITQNETWDFDIKVYNDIKVKTGNTLTIKCRVLMPHMGNIIVEPGAHLVIDGGTITSERESDVWYGIYAAGNKSKHQYGDMSAPGGYWQGRVVIKNGAIIENALHAIIAENGGTIVAENSTFRNNKRSIGYHEYHNYNPVNPSQPRGNLSRFTNCTFEITRQLPPSAQFTCDRVDDIRIHGCKFVNAMPSGTGTDRHVAVVGFGSKMVVDHYCASPGPMGTCNSVGSPSIIEGFRIGVQSDGLWGFGSNNLKIAHTTFRDNQVGIDVRSTNGFHANDNTFWIDDLSSGAAAHGIRAYGAPLHDISNNTFNRGEGLRSFNTTGVDVAECGHFNHLIKNNTFNNLMSGGLSQGYNFDQAHHIPAIANGLMFKCNTFNQVTYCIGAVGHNYYDGMRYHQGEANDPAGNVFNHWGIGGGGAVPTTVDVYLSPGINPCKYFYYTGNAAENPAIIAGAVTKLPVGVPGACDPNAVPSGGTGLPVRIGTKMTKAGNDDDDPNGTEWAEIVGELLAEPGAYTKLILADMALAEGDVAAASDTYNEIFDLEMAPEEMNEFVEGKVLLDIAVAMREEERSLSEATSTEIDAIQEVFNHTTMWARAKAGNWLKLITGTDYEYDYLQPEGYGGKSAGILEEEDQRFRIYPNPSDKLFNIRYEPRDEDMMLEITNLFGEVVGNYTLPKTNRYYTIDASNWATGLYFYKVKQGNTVVKTNKLIKQ